MKNLLAAALLTTVGLSLGACTNEEDDIFDHSAAERLNTISGTYTQRLADSKGGWVMEYYPYTDNEDMITGMGYLIMSRFHENGSVYTAMKNKATGNVLWTDSSAYSVLTYMGPVLSFNSYNKCLGRFSDPNDIDLTPGRYDDESGKGFQGDYEFVMVDVPEGGNHIMLKGVKRGIYQRMTRVPEGTDFEKYLDDVTSFQTSMFPSSANWEYTMIENGTEYRINWMQRGYGTIYQADKDSTTYGVHNPYTIIKDGDVYSLRFKDTVMVEGRQMEQVFNYNPADDMFHGAENADNVIRGYQPSLFFEEHFNNRWVLSAQASENSASAQAFYDQMVEGFKTAGYTLNSVSFMNYDNEFVLRFQYRKGRTTSYVYYAYKVERNGDNVTLTYDHPVKNGETAMNAIPAIRDMVNKMSQTFTVKPLSSGFNVSKLKLVSTTDTDYWSGIILYNN